MSEGEKPPNAGPQGLGMEDALKLTMELCRDPKTAHLADSVASALLALIGSGPALTALQGMQAAQVASAGMFQNAVTNQQCTNIVGMVATMNCVQALLDRPSEIPWPDFPNPMAGPSYGEG